MAEVPGKRNCAAHDIHQAMLAADPNYALARSSIEAQAEAFEAAIAAGADLIPGSPRVIPVVAHVIHRGGSENISDAQIKSQIDVLNLDFRMKNADAGQVPGVFQPFAADAKIEFALATKDPAGVATTGITRTQTTVGQFSANNDMKFASRGGHDAWDSSRYLNIWICPEIVDMGRVLLGYAQFPGGIPATDGVAIIHNAFGTIGTATSPFNLGRTATHEVGHWLDLRHIWGDVDDCATDDMVADTPIQFEANYNTPTHPHVSCPGNPKGDMFMNYMDYVDDVAMFMFSAGQVARMQATLAGPRSTIGMAGVAAIAGVGGAVTPP